MEVFAHLQNCWGAQLTARFGTFGLETPSPAMCPVLSVNLTGVLKGNPLGANSQWATADQWRPQTSERGPLGKRPALKLLLPPVFLDAAYWTNHPAARGSEPAGVIWRVSAPAREEGRGWWGTQRSPRSCLAQRAAWLNQAHGAHTRFPYLPLMIYKRKGNVGDVYVVISPGYDEN